MIFQRVDSFLCQRQSARSGREAFVTGGHNLRQAIDTGFQLILRAQQLVGRLLAASMDIYTMRLRPLSEWPQSHFSLVWDSDVVSRDDCAFLISATEQRRRL